MPVAGWRSWVGSANTWRRETKVPYLALKKRVLLALTSPINMHYPALNP